MTETLGRDRGGYVGDLVVMLRFYSRLPLPPMPWESDPHGWPNFERASRAVPVAGAILGAIGGVVLALAIAVGVPSTPAALIALAAMILSTGAFHEDGLADTADGIGGGATRERKLEIMKDSRIGTYGGAALVLSIGLRATLLAAIADRAGLLPAALVLIASGAVSRTAALWLGRSLAPARADGAAYAAGRPSGRAFSIAVASASAIAVLAIGPVLGPVAVVTVLCAGALVAYLMARLAFAQIGGQTGDVAGATQQIAEIAVLVALVVVTAR